MSERQKIRIESLDWLRGAMAIAIMAYHLFMWLYHDIDASCLLGRLGVYAVAIFFILSGLSMAIVYDSFILGWRSSGVFLIRRLFRIWPLFWVCTAFVTLQGLLAGTQVDIGKIILNATTAFGFIKPDAYMVTGGWSIGNEMVYYAFTPLIILAYKRHVLFGNCILGISFLILTAFAFLLLKPDLSLCKQWETYINPFNNLFLYVAGVAIYFNLRTTRFSLVTVIAFMAISSLVFVTFPISGDQIGIVTGASRIVFVSASVLLVIAVYKFEAYGHVPKRIAIGLEQLGIATYGIYLLHPFAQAWVSKVLGKIFGLADPLPRFAGTIILTITLAILSFNFFESRVMKLGKKWTSKLLMIDADLLKAKFEEEEAKKPKNRELIVSSR